MVTSTKKLLISKAAKIQKPMDKGKQADADLAIARKIQAAMIPRVLPPADGLSMASLYLPNIHVGGDQYDVIKLSEKLFAFLIFDVTGHGVSSALLSSLARVFFTNQLRDQNSPRAVIERVNQDLISAVNTDFFLTAFVGFLDLHDNRLTYSNAGHAYPLLYRSKVKKLEVLKTQGTFLGLFENGFYEEQSLILDPEDWLFLFTDGIYRVFDASSVQKGRTAFELQILDLIGGASPEDVISQLRSRCLDKMAVVEDDITAVAVKLEPDSVREALKESLNFNASDVVYIQFVRYFEDIDKAVGAVLAGMDKAGYGDDSIRRMKVSLPELLINALNHGNRKDFLKKVTVGHTVSPRKTVVSVLDQGEGFDPSAVPDPTLEENIMKDCGRGLFITRNYCDKIEWNEKGNRVTITINHEKAKGD